MPRCPALFVAAPASGQGKTTVTAALACLHARQGRTVRLFKCGPDFSIRRSINSPAVSLAIPLISVMCGAAMPRGDWRPLRKQPT